MKHGDAMRREIIVDALRRFESLPNRTIARYILQQHGSLFDGNLELIRDRIRYITNKQGAKHRARSGERVLRDGKKLVLPKTWRTQRTPHKISPGRWLGLFDVHVPFHEPIPINAAIAYGKEHNVDGILFGGDLQDCEAVSFWKSSRRPKFDEEIEMLLDFLDFIDQEFPGIPKVWKPGNHEYRLPRYYQSKAPELIGLPLAAFDTVLSLESRGITMLDDYFQIIMAGKLPILHGHEVRISRAVNPARGLFLRTKSWALCGHCHTTSEHSTRDIGGTLITTWSVGCLCDLSPDYNPYGDWNWGFCMIDVQKNGNFVVTNKRILPSGEVV